MRPKPQFQHMRPRSEKNGALGNACPGSTIYPTNSPLQPLNLRANRP
ncbi:hypothetical protein SAMN04487998_3767 [Hymenobacter actinosclerus]|uniref:Uncharacterized protein n=1 Tax=Hymenobacter actinosclerus TaxID=82805 RepID=A0A1I0JEK4_9BACT|nr:hypothetical protein SAMN04487998_3767 [Hymenobacter actinosclerus]